MERLNALHLAMRENHEDLRPRVTRKLYDPGPGESGTGTKGNGGGITLRKGFDGGGSTLRKGFEWRS
jgi:hypothetical protein